jgi:hypothetical protein
MCDMQHPGDHAIQFGAVEDLLPVRRDDRLAPVVHRDQASLGERVRSAQRVRQRDLGVPEQHRLGGCLGYANGVDRFLQRLGEQPADHAGDGLDERRLQEGELLHRHPVHVEYRCVHRPDHCLGPISGNAVAGRAVACRAVACRAVACRGRPRLDGSHHFLRCCLAAEGIGPFLLARTLQEHRRMTGMRDRQVQILTPGEDAGVGGGWVQGQHDRTRLGGWDDSRRDIP